MKGIKLAWCVSTIVALSGAFQAVNAAIPVPAGWYIEGNLGSSRVKDINYGTGTSYSNSGRATNIDVGYKFIPYFAFEGGYTKYSDSRVALAGTTIATDSRHAWDIAGKAILPFSDSGFELFVKLGLARTLSHLVNKPNTTGAPLPTTQGQNKATGVYYGIGADYATTPQLPIILQWSRAKGDHYTGTQDLFSVGIAYIFT